MPDAETAKTGREPDTDAKDSDEHGSIATAREPKTRMQSTKEGKARSKATRPCRFWGTKNGCRAGDSCPFFHDASAVRDSVSSTSRDNGLKATVEKAHERESSGAPKAAAAPSASRADASRVVAKPTPRSDPRSFQIQQIIRRFSPEVNTTSTETSMSIQLRPSDPDFPFEMPYLDCVLHVPTSYPSLREALRIDVKNKEMDRGFQINVEKGFESIVVNGPNGTLLGWMNALDRKLEEFLTGEKAETIKIVANRSNPVRAKPGGSVAELGPRAASKPTEDSYGPVSEPSDKAGSRPQQQPIYTSELLNDASARRTTEARQLEARMGRVTGYSKSMPVGATVYNVPVDPRNRSGLPVSLRSIKTLQLTVPNLYPLENSSIKLLGVAGPDVETVQHAWDRRQQEPKPGGGATLMGRVNELAANMHSWIRETVAKEGVSAGQTNEALPIAAPPIQPKPEAPPAKSAQVNLDDDKPHVQIIPRPPEWDQGSNQSASEDSLSSDSDSDSGTESEEEEDTNPAHDATIATSAPSHGIALSFPSLALRNIELLVLNTLSITAKCLRCKTQLEITNLNPAATTPKVNTCSKCSSIVTATFRSALIHPSSSTAGYLDITGATPTDLLPSPFTPTCASCSTSLPAPGLLAVRGDEPRAVCRSCHQHISFMIPEVKFLSLSSYAATHSSGLPPRRKQPKERLGLTAGEPLPRRGRCQHYGKSYRWFRFSCCDKVYACDRCHDAAEQHPVERAERMICGFCSREQRFRPEDCGICHAPVTGKKGGGFWEGGKGTRDRVKMSRKDKRKYRKVIGGSKGKGRDK